MIVMLGYFQHPLARNIAAAQHVFEKRNDVFPFFGSTEGENEKGIIVFAHP